ncbi:MAG: flagellar biosynthetic protein FliR [Thermodesulfobacteriota bacterium]
MPFPLESLEQMQGFFWVFLRVTVLLFLLPLFGARGFPTLWKVGVSFVIALVLTPVVPLPKTFPETVQDVLMGVFSEVVMGVCLGFGARLLLASVQLAGQFMSFQMGFSMAGAIDPQEGGQSTTLSQFLYIFTVLLFLAMDGHHLFLTALARSFALVPPCAFAPKPGLARIVIQSSGQMFLVALKISAPILIALFLSNLCLGIVARTVPQVNILMIGFPLNISIGLILFGLTLGSLSPYLIDLTRGIGELMLRMMKWM